MKPLFRHLATSVLLSLLLGGLALLQFWPARPSSWLGWLLLFVLALPLQILGEYLGEWIFRNPLSQAVERRTQGQPFSWLRVLTGLLALLLLIAAGLGLAWRWA